MVLVVMMMMVLKVDGRWLQYHENCICCLQESEKQPVEKDEKEEAKD